MNNVILKLFFFDKNPITIGLGEVSEPTRVENQYQDRYGFSIRS